MIAYPLATSAEIPENDGLVAKAAEGDLSAFEAIYREHAGRINALCRRLTGSVEEADEMVQEVFIRAWQKLAAFEARASLSTWLHQIAVRLVIDAGRARKRRPMTPLEVVPQAAAPSSPAGLRLDLEYAVEALPDGARQVLVLHDVYGHSHDEIAALCGITTGTSKSQLHRARMLLRERLS
jgi:RNA polymerase sigma-70 factor (ECF subfamily)